MLQWALLVVVILALVMLAGIAIWVQTEAPFRKETRPAAGRRALILYHPSRDANFSDDLTHALAGGFEEAGLAADRWTITRDTPAAPNGYAVIAIVSNTFLGAPDWPTARYLKRARLDGQEVIAIMAGSGSTGRAERTLRNLLDGTGADRIEVRSLWTKRPNQPGSEGPGNRRVALRLARTLARSASEPLVQTKVNVQPRVADIAASSRTELAARVRPTQAIGIPET